MPKIRVQSTAEDARGFIPNTRASGASGAAIGSAIKSLGSAVSGLGGALLAEQREREALNRSLDLSEFDANAQRELAYQQENMEDGAPQFTANYDRTLEKEKERLLEGRTGEDRRRMEVAIEKRRRQFGTRAYMAEISEQSRFERERIQGSMDKHINIIRANPGSYESSVEVMGEVFDNMTLPPKVKEDLKDNFADNAARARFHGQLETAKSQADIDRIADDLKSGDWDTILAPEAKSALMKSVEAQRGKLLKASFSEAKAWSTDLKARMAAGEEIPSSYFEHGMALAERTGSQAVIDEATALSSQYFKRQNLRGATPEQMGEEIESSKAAAATGSKADAYVQAASLLRSKEGFRSVPYNDPQLDSQGKQRGSNIWRAGYGSDTYTTADGKVHKVTRNSRVSREDAERDLQRRMREFENVAARNVGKDSWSKLPSDVKAVLIGLTYNYGKIPADRGSGANLRSAIQSGDRSQIAAEVRKLAGDNGGINRTRRNREADLILSGSGVPMDPEAAGEHAAVVSKAQEMKKGLEDNPIKYAADEGVISEYAPLDFNDGGESFTQRGVQAAQTEEYYGTRVEKVLTPNEVSTIKDIIDNGTEDQVYTAVSQLGKLGEYADEAYKQVKEINPAMGYAGYVSGQDEALARRIISGNKMMDDLDGKLGPRFGTNSERNKAFSAAVGASLDYRGSAAQSVKEAADALYAFKIRGRGGEEFDQELYSEAITEALGGEVAQVGASTTITPKGVSAEEFDDFSERLTEGDLVDLSASGLPPIQVDGTVDPEWFASEANWINVAPGVYGFDSVLGERVVDSSGQPYLMQVDQESVESVLSREQSRSSRREVERAEQFGSPAPGITPNPDVEVIKPKAPTAARRDRRRK